MPEAARGDTAHDVTLPTFIATSVVRGAQQGESHGGVYLLDFQARQVDQVVDWNTGDIDFTGRGWDRGLRGIAFFGGEIYIAASDELFVYGRDFSIKRSYRSSYLRHCHEIHVHHKYLYLTSTGHDSILAFDLEQQRFVWALHLACGEDGSPTGTAYDPNGMTGPGGAKGPPARNELHLNMVYVDDRGPFVSGLRTGGILQVRSDNAVRRIVDLPTGTHNARPFRDGVIFHDTDADTLRYVPREGAEIRFRMPRYDPAELTHTELGDERLARQAFGRGLAIVDDRFVAAGSSPSTVTLYDLEQRMEVGRVNFSMDIRNAIHGLEVWPWTEGRK